MEADRLTHEFAHFSAMGRERGRRNGGRTRTEGGTHYTEKIPLTSSSAATERGRQTNEPIHLDSLYGP